MDKNTSLEPLNYNGGYDQQNNNDDDQNHDHLSLDLSLTIHAPGAPPQMAPNLAAAGHHHPIMVQPPFQTEQPSPAQFHHIYLDVIEASSSPTHHFHPPYVNPFESASSSSAPPQQQPSSQTRASSSSGRRKRKPVAIPEPYPWATNKRAIVHSLEELRCKGISTVTGQLHCKCGHIFEQTFNLQQKFSEIARFVMMNKNNMHNRAPERWQNPVLPVCPNCNQNNAKPYRTKKKSINWLFMFLGEYLSCCKLSELKYFCKHASYHRTGAKDRLIYNAYIGICNQLDPLGRYY